MRFVQLMIITALCIAPANAIVITGISVNGVQLVSDGESATWGLPSTLSISRLNGRFLFDVKLASDDTQNPDEGLLGDSFNISFFANPGNLLQTPDDFTSQNFFVGNLPGMPSSVSFTRTFSTEGIFDGGFSVMMSNSTATYRSFFSGYETHPTFNFSLFNNPITPLGDQNFATGGTAISGGASSALIDNPEPGTFGLMVGGGLLLFQLKRGKACK